MTEEIEISNSTVREAGPESGGGGRAEGGVADMGVSASSSSPYRQLEGVGDGDLVEDPNLPNNNLQKKNNKLKLLPLIFLIYFEVSGGPYGEETAVQAAGPLLAIVGFLVFPFIWSIPESLITAELATTFPGNGGFVIWAERAFGPFWGNLMGFWKFLSGVINNAAYPVLCVDYLKRIFPIFASGVPRVIAICAATVSLTFLNYTGLTIVGYTAVALAVVSMLPFYIMGLVSIPKLRPHRWISMGDPGVKKDWHLYLNTLFWNLNFWDNASTLAGEVDRPQKTFPKALISAGVVTIIGYLVPLLAATGALELEQDKWGDGYLADAAGMIVGKWLKYWVEVGAALSAIGLFEAQLSSAAYQIVGMADLGFIPRFFAVRSKWFNTPWVGIVLSSAITLAISFMDFTNIISSANFLYSLGMLLEIASFIWLRKKYPKLDRPYKVPMGIPGLVAMCAIPTGFLILVMIIGSMVVYVISAALTVVGIGSYFIMKSCKERSCLKFTKQKEHRDEEIGNINEG
ncbi:probable polyamine transporter At3g13620 [Macadamia integrifolia]|uniref:probable polyamine transporter At3g13620 n=1 Tax=Macadamia integrifolia TaxID=60698 RepID=UPI001C4EEA1B|nr:probable polyamine transporter At3g13620 [Macadamia integrifolia]